MEAIMQEPKSISTLRKMLAKSILEGTTDIPFFVKTKTILIKDDELFYGTELELNKTEKIEKVSNDLKKRLFSSLQPNRENNGFVSFFEDKYNKANVIWHTWIVDVFLSFIKEKIGCKVIVKGTFFDNAEETQKTLFIRLQPITKNTIKLTTNKKVFLFKIKETLWLRKEKKNSSEIVECFLNTIAEILVTKETFDICDSRYQKITDFYDRYVAFCKKNNYSYLNMNGFLSKLKKMGHEESLVGDSIMLEILPF